ncbi:MAG: hypothetical protein ABR503_15070, partial [Chitinophagaceae bacterium]
LTLNEALEIEGTLDTFCNQWKSHDEEVTAYANLFFGQFLVFMSDEKRVKVSGCSTDSSVRFVKELGSVYQVDFFNRGNLAFFIKDKIELLPITQLQYAFKNRFINGDTIYFNNLVLTKKELEEKWIIPVKDSWLAKKLQLTA